MGGCDGTRPRVCHPRWAFDLSTPDYQAISKKSHTVAPRCTWRHRYDRSNVRVQLSECYLRLPTWTILMMPVALRWRCAMTKHYALVFAVGCATASSIAVAQQHHTAAQTSDEELIKSAMSATPPAVAQDAAIVAVGPDGKMRTIRKGSNTFTCMPDNPATPGPDPMCMDQNGLEWATAWIEHRIHRKARLGSCICWRAALIPRTPTRMLKSQMQTTIGSRRGLTSCSLGPRA